MDRSKIKTFSIVNAVAYLVMIAVNALAQLRVLGGKTTAEISDKYPSLFTPAGITFAIWGVIYVLLAIFIVRQLLRSGWGLTKKAGWLFILSCVLNALWIIAWQFEWILLSTVDIVLLWVVLWRLEQQMREEKLLDRITFSIYYAWITVATVAAVFSLITRYAPGWTETLFAQILTVVALILTGWLSYTVGWAQRNIAYIATILWAQIGIMIRHLSATGYAGRFPGIIAVCVIVEAVSAGCLIAVCLRQRKKEE